MSKFRLIKDIIRPEPLIYYDGIKFGVFENAFKKVSKIEGPVCVIGIAGPQRLGKSYIMNLLFEEKKGFDLGSTVISCTRGLWIWAKEAEIGGEKHTIILLDTEGMYSHDRSSEFNNKVITICVLLSSLFVYNTGNCIKKDSLDRLCFVSQMNISIILIRDGKGELLPVSEDEYLDFSIRNKEIDDPEDDPDGVRHNENMDEFRDAFPVRKLFCLVRPLGDETKLRDIESYEEDIVPEFIEKVKEIKNYIYSNLEPKEFKTNFQQWNGEIFGLMAKKFCENINNNFVDVDSSFEHVINLKNKKVVRNIIEKYRVGMKDLFDGEVLPLDTEEFIEKQEDLRKLLLSSFIKDVISIKKNEQEEEDGEMMINENTEILSKEKWRVIILQEISKIYNLYQKKNEEASKKKCTKFLEKGVEKIHKNFTERKYFKKEGCLELSSDFNELEEKYRNLKNKGPSSSSTLENFQIEKFKVLSQIVIVNDMIEDSEHKKIEVEMERRLEIYKREAAEAEFEFLKKQLEEDNKIHIEEMEMFQKDFEEETERIIRLNTEKNKQILKKRIDLEELKLQEEIEALDDQLKRQGLEHQVLMNKRKKEQEDMRKKIFSQRKKLEDLRRERERPKPFCVIL